MCQPWIRQFGSYALYPLLETLKITLISQTSAGKLNIKQNITCAQVFGPLCLQSFGGNLFVVYPLFNTIDFEENISVKSVFSKCGITMRNPKKIQEKGVG